MVLARSVWICIALPEALAVLSVQAAVLSPWRIHGRGVRVFTRIPAVIGPCSRSKRVPADALNVLETTDSTIAKVMFGQIAQRWWLEARWHRPSLFHDGRRHCHLAPPKTTNLD